MKKTFGMLVKKQSFVYILVGGFTTGLDLFLYWLLIDSFGVWYILSAIVISPLTLGLNFSLHRLFTFKSDGSRKRQIPRYLLLVLFNYVAGVLLLYAFVDILQFDYFWGRIAQFAVIMFWNFTALKLVVFR